MYTFFLKSMKQEYKEKEGKKNAKLFRKAWRFGDICLNIQKFYVTFPHNGIRRYVLSAAEATEYDDCNKNDKPNVIIKSISQAT